MATKPPTSAWRWLVRRLNSTVFGDIWPELVFFSGIATMVDCVERFTDTKMQVPLSLLTALGTVLGLVISFRTSSAYDHYWEGRKLWGNIILHSRNLGQLIWIHVPVDRPAKKDDPEVTAKSAARLKAIIERKTMVNLVQAFSVSVKHYLRSEPGIYYEDLYPLIASLPQDISVDSDTRRPISTLDTLPLWHDVPDPNEKEAKKAHKRKGSDHEKLLSHSDKTTNLKPARNPPQESIYYYLPILILFRPAWLLIRKTFKSPSREPVYDTHAPYRSRTLWGKKRRIPPIDSNIPLEIILFLSGYVHILLVKGLLIHPSANACLASITALQDALSGLERVRTTPIPFAYQTHLRMCVWLYLLFLPFQLHEQFGILVIPATFLATFLYVGFLEIGTEIENPFDYDENDLDLDQFCLTIQRELAEVVAHPTFDPAVYAFGSHNQPFAPGDRRTAEEIISQVDHDYHSEEDGIRTIRRTLLRSFREISEATVVEGHRDDD